MDPGSQTGKPRSRRPESSVATLRETPPNSPGLHGRRRGKKLGAHHAALLRTVLPCLSFDVSRPIADPASLFPDKPSAIWLEIGFGGAEHLAAKALAHPDIGFIGCEAYLNGIAKALAYIEAGRLRNVRIYNGNARAVIEALQALRGVAQTTAATIVSELGSVSRFQSPGQLMGYSGLVAREHSSGNRVRRGGITKTGNSHLRRVLVEAAWAYQHRPNVTGFLLRRQKNLALSDEVKKIAWKAQQRLHKRYQAFAARDKNKNQIVTALGRELLGFIWAIAVHTEGQQKQLSKTA
jgi:hypothetical protein